MGTRRKNPPQSPTSSGSSDATPKHPGAAAPGPTLIDLTAPIAIEVTATLADTPAGREAGAALMKSIRRARHARECGGIVRLR